MSKFDNFRDVAEETTNTVVTLLEGLQQEYETVRNETVYEFSFGQTETTDDRIRKLIAEVKDLGVELSNLRFRKKVDIKYRRTNDPRFKAYELQHNVQIYNIHRGNVKVGNRDLFDLILTHKNYHSSSKKRPYSLNVVYPASVDLREGWNLPIGAFSNYELVFQL